MFAAVAAELFHCTEVTGIELSCFQRTPTVYFVMYVVVICLKLCIFLNAAHLLMQTKLMSLVRYRFY